MNKREKLLIAVVGCAVVLFVASMFYRSYSSGIKKLNTDLAKAEKDVSDIDLKLKMARTAEGRLAVWREQSLPNDTANPGSFQSQEHAYNAYSEWLRETLTDAMLKPDRVEPAPNTLSISPTIRTIGVSTESKGSLDALVDFLHKFYSTPQLHQISRIELRPVTGAQDGSLTIKLQAEALMLPGAGNNKVPAEGKLNPFKLADASEYRFQIARRDLFRPYRRPADPPVVAATRAENALDDSNFARFTGATLGNKGLVAWIYLTNKGDQLLVAEGDNVNVGSLRSKVASVESRALVLDKSDNTRVRVEIGSYIKDGKQVAKPAPPPTPKPAAEEDKDANADALEPEDI